MTLTSMVNFPVSSSARSGSSIGSNPYRPSRCRISSCCSYRATARGMSNFRASRNLVAIAGVTAFRFGSLLLELFIRSMNCFTACEVEMEKEERKRRNENTGRGK